MLIMNNYKKIEKLYLYGMWHMYVTYNTTG
jgi:hypothetical protein